MTLTDCYVIKYIKRQSLPCFHSSPTQLSLFTAYLKEKDIFNFVIYTIVSHKLQVYARVAAAVVKGKGLLWDKVVQEWLCWSPADCAGMCWHWGTDTGSVSELVLDCSLMHFGFTSFAFYQLLPQQLPSPQSEYFWFWKQLLVVPSRLFCDLLPALLIPFPRTNQNKKRVTGTQTDKSSQIFWSTLYYSCCW